MDVDFFLWYTLRNHSKKPLQHHLLVVLYIVNHLNCLSGSVWSIASVFKPARCREHSPSPSLGQSHHSPVPPIPQHRSPPLQLQGPGVTPFWGRGPRNKSLKSTCFLQDGKEIWGAGGWVKWDRTVGGELGRGEKNYTAQWRSPISLFNTNHLTSSPRCT